MQGLNKAISFILGLIVVVVFIAIVSGRLKIGNLLPALSKNTITPTITMTPTPTNTPNSNMGSTGTNDTNVQQTGTTTNQYQQNQTSKGGVSNVNNIPNTGAPTLLLPFAISALLGGVLLRRSGKKRYS